MSIHQPKLVEPPPPGGSRLLQLPVEISDEIFKFVLPCPTTIHVIDSSDNGWNDYFIYLGRSHFLCSAQPLRIFCSRFNRRCWNITRPLYCGRTFPRLHLALFRTCRQIYEQTHYLFYSLNTFDLSLYDSRISGSRLGCSFLQQIGPRARSLITKLSIATLVIWCANWGATVPLQDNPRITFDKETDEAMPQVFQAEIEKICAFVAEMPRLRYLALTFSLRNMLGWHGNVVDVPWVQPLLGLCDSGGFAGVFFLTTKSRIHRISTHRKALGRFMVTLADEMRKRRMRSGKSGVEWGTSLGVECVDYCPIPLANDTDKLHMRLLEAGGCADCWNYSCQRHHDNLTSCVAVP